MIERIVAAHPDGAHDHLPGRHLRLHQGPPRSCRCARASSRRRSAARIPRELQFISTNRIDAMSPERLAAMRARGLPRAGLRHRELLAPGARASSTRRRSIRTSSRCWRGPGAGHHAVSRPDPELAAREPRRRGGDTARAPGRWLQRGCEIGHVPVRDSVLGRGAGARSGADALHTSMTRRRIAGTQIAWDQPAKILPIDPDVRDAILRIERDFERRLAQLQPTVAASAFARALAAVDSVAARPSWPRMASRWRTTGEVRAALMARLPQRRASARVPSQPHEDRRRPGPCWRPLRCARC